jgi:hypothetical protein
MSVTVCLMRTTVEFHLDFWRHPAMARKPFRLRKFAGTSVRIVAMKGPPGLTEMIQNFAVEAIRFFPVGSGPSPPSNSGFGWCNIARISLFACPNSRAFQYSSRRGKATGQRIWVRMQTCGHQQLPKTSYNSSSHKFSPKRTSLIGFSKANDCRLSEMIQTFPNFGDNHGLCERGFEFG